MDYWSYAGWEGFRWKLILSKSWIKEHKKDYFDLTEDEHSELNLMIIKAKSLIEREHTPDGYNIGINCGESAGQTIMHFHCHLIPRRTGDIENPRGGVRGVIPDKMSY